MRASGWWRGLVLERQRRREELASRERQRREVVKKHLERAKEESRGGARENVGAGGGGRLHPVRRDAAREGEGGRGQVFDPKAAAGRAAGPAGRAPRADGEEARSAAARAAVPASRDASGWVFPPEKLLRAAPKRDRERDREEFRQTMELIAAKCLEFGVEGVVDAYTPGPVVTTYEFKPSPGVKVSQVASLENDLALALAAEKVRIERMPGRAAIGIEVPNRNRDIIALREVVESEKFRRSPSLLTIALGIDVHGEPDRRGPGAHAAPPRRGRRRAPARASA